MYFVWLSSYSNFWYSEFISNVLFTNIYTNNFLKTVSNSTRLHNRIYGGHRITFPAFYPLLVLVISVVFNRVVIRFNLLHRHQSRFGCFLLMGPLNKLNAILDLEIWYTTQPFRWFKYSV